MKTSTISAIIGLTLTGGAGIYFCIKFFKKKKDKKQIESNTSDTKAIETTIWTGISEADTLALQKKLNSQDIKIGNQVINRFSIKEDGKYGTETKNAVRQIQTALNKEFNLNLTVDGLYGSETKSAFEKNVK